MPKPGDFFLGAMRFLGIFVPGALLIWTALPCLRDVAFGFGLMAESEPVQAAAFALLAYVVGHILHALVDWLSEIGGKCLDRIGCRCLKVDFSRYRDTLNSGNTQSEKDFFNFCWSRLRIAAPDAAAEIDAWQADFKMFRALALVLLAGPTIRIFAEYHQCAKQTCLPSPWLDHGGWVAIAAVALALISAFRAFQLYKLSYRRCYEFILVLSVSPRTLSRR